jgi:hypothetical protein
LPEAISAVKCNACHQDDKTDLLPGSHESYSLVNTEICFGCHRDKGESRPIGAKIHQLHKIGSHDITNDCLDCHIFTSQGTVVLPGKGIEISQARIAELETYFKSSMAVGSHMLDRRHLQKEVSCSGCHADYLEENRLSGVQCTKCHGDYNDMIKKTKESSYENNPHNVPHMPGLQCDACHHVHKGFEDICMPCHEYGYAG